MIIIADNQRSYSVSSNYITTNPVISVRFTSITARCFVMAPTDAETSDRASSRERSRAGSSSTAHEESLYAINPFNFDAKTSYEATESLLQTRAAAYERPEPPKDHDIWKLPPPDFRPQCYEPRPPPRNSREAIKPWKYGTIPGRRPQPITRHSAPLRLPSILQERQEEEGQFVTAFKIDGPWEAKLLYVKEGVFRPGRYQMPKPHDFRGVRFLLVAF